MGEYVFSGCADNLAITIAGKKYTADAVKDGLKQKSFILDFYTKMLNFRPIFENGLTIFRNMVLYYQW